MIWKSCCARSRARDQHRRDKLLRTLARGLANVRVVWVEIEVEVERLRARHMDLVWEREIQKSRAQEVFRSRSTIGMR